MTRTLVFVLHGLQSWGTGSKTGCTYVTETHPTRSGMVGMFGAALGIDRDADPSWSESLEFAVRADRPGVTEFDYHTSGGGYEVGLVTGKSTFASIARSRNATVSQRFYLADAAFTVAVSGPDDLIGSIDAALRAPVYTPFMGRKAFPVNALCVVGTTTEPPGEVLARIPAYRPEPYKGDVAAYALVGVEFEDVADDAPKVTATLYSENPQYASRELRDIPVSFGRWDRRYRMRRVGEDVVRVPAAGTGVDGFVAMRDALEAVAA